MTNATHQYRDYLKVLQQRSTVEGTCLTWQGSKTRLGYGQISYRNKLESVHRVAWIEADGPIPSGIEVDHTCHNRACVNPAHLRLAEHHQNGRNLSGAHSRSRLGVRNVRLKGKRFEVSVGNTYVGRFDTLEEASVAAEKERAIKYGEFQGRG
jgi:hypothetical protein